MQKKIFYVGEFPFPRGAAASIRVLGIGRILAECGYEVSFYGLDSEKENPDGPSGTFEKFRYNNLVLKTGNIKERLLNRVMAGRRTIKLFESLKPDYIILAGGYCRYMIPLLAYSRKHKVKIIVDVVEWFDYSHLPGGKFGFRALDTHFALTGLMKKCDGIIAISSFLERYFVNSKVKTVRVPILIDKEESSNHSQKDESFTSDYLHLIYAGIPGRKDIVDIVIYGLELLLKDGVKIKLHLVGPSRESLKELLGDKGFLIDDLKESIILHGKVAQEKVPSLLANADFSFLIRPNMRYANAGFPTKFVESMNAGLPIICNLTSDLGMYLEDGKNGFIMQDTSVESFIRCVKKASLLSAEEKNQMKKAAKDVAIKSFDFRNFIPQVKDFLMSVDSPA